MGYLLVVLAYSGSLRDVLADYFCVLYTVVDFNEPIVVVCIYFVKSMILTLYEEREDLATPVLNQDDLDGA